MAGPRALALALVTILAACSTAAVAEVPTPSPEPTHAPTPMPTEAPTPTPTVTPVPDWTALPEAANDAPALARQLAMVEAALRDPSVTGAELAYMGHLQQLVYSRLRDYPDWQEQVTARLPEVARTAVLGSLEASRHLRTIRGPIPRTLPDWKVLEPKLIDVLLGYYKEAQEAYGIGWTYLAAIHLVESRMGRIRGLSTAGAQGPMQFMPSTWAAYGKGDVNDDHDAILAAARYLRAAGGPGDMRKALYAYNHSDGYVNALIAYAKVLRADPTAYRGYHGWQVYYTTQEGTYYLPVGWTKPAN